VLKIRLVHSPMCLYDIVLSKSSTGATLVSLAGGFDSGDEVECKYVCLRLSRRLLSRVAF
jgi:hypothetical protein